MIFGGPDLNYDFSMTICKTNHANYLRFRCIGSQIKNLKLPKFLCVCQHKKMIEACGKGCDFKPILAKLGLTSQSVRIGAALSIYNAGIAPERITIQLRWASTEMLVYYVRLLNAYAHRLKIKVTWIPNTEV